MHILHIKKYIQQCPKRPTRAVNLTIEVLENAIFPEFGIRNNESGGVLVDDLKVRSADDVKKYVKSFKNQRRCRLFT